MNVRRLLSVGNVWPALFGRCSVRCVMMLKKFKERKLFSIGVEIFGRRVAFIATGFQKEHAVIAAGA